MFKSSKPQAIIIAALLVLTVISTLSATSAVFGTITNRPTLYVVTGTVNSDGTLTVSTNTTADPINTYWNSNATLVGISISGMTISGGQVWLWISSTGGAAVEAGDQWYAGPFRLTQIAAVVTNYLNVTDPYSGETFWVGNNQIIGPMTTSKVVPVGGTYYAKITDVSPTSSAASSDVSVSVNRWSPIPSISISPSSGPAGTLITLTGVAFDPSKLINITFADTALGTTPVVLGPFSANSNGTFSTSFYASDTQELSAISDNRYVNVYYNGTTSILDSLLFVENGREWLLVANNLGGYGVGVNGYNGGEVDVLSSIVLNGNYFNPRGPVTFYWDWGLSTQVTLGTVTPNATGYFNFTTATVPVSSLGAHTISAVDYSYNFNATVDVQTTLVLTPTKGPVGTTVTATGYGYTDSTSGTTYTVTLWWTGYAYINLTVVNVDTNGQFTTTFMVPHDFGGDHNVAGVENNVGATTANATFTVTPTLMISPSPSANDGSVMTATGTGFEPSVRYAPNIDNHYLGANDLDGYTGNVWSNGTGDIEVQWVAAGFMPGWHVFSLYPTTDSTPFQPMENGANTYALFNITGTSMSTIAGMLSNMNATLTTLSGNVVSIQAAVTSIQGTLATVQTNLGTLQGTVTSIQGTVATIQTNVGTVQADVSTVKGNLPVDMTPVWIAVGLSLIAAIAAAIAAVGIFRKMA